MTTGIQATDAASAAVATAPRVALADIEAKIVRKLFARGSDLIVRGSADEPLLEEEGPLELLTICLLVMSNGFTVIGKSAPASPENFNADLGEQFAYEDAIRQLWPLEGYLLRQRLVEANDA